MIKNLVRAFSALSLALVPVLSAPAAQAAPAAEVTTLADEVGLVEVTSVGSLDIDHMVPLAEAWDSGASA